MTIAGFHGWLVPKRWPPGQSVFGGLYSSMAVCKKSCCKYAQHKFFDAWMKGCGNVSFSRTLYLSTSGQKCRANCLYVMQVFSMGSFKIFRLICTDTPILVRYIKHTFAIAGADISHSCLKMSQAERTLLTAVNQQCICYSAIFDILSYVYVRCRWVVLRDFLSVMKWHRDSTQWCSPISSR